MIMQSISFIDCLLLEIEECLNGFAYKISQFKDIASCKLITVCAISPFSYSLVMQVFLVFDNIVLSFIVVNAYLASCSNSTAIFWLRLADSSFSVASPAAWN